MTDTISKRKLIEDIESMLRDEPRYKSNDFIKGFNQACLLIKNLAALGAYSEDPTPVGDGNTYVEG